MIRCHYSSLYDLVRLDISSFPGLISSLQNLIGKLCLPSPSSGAQVFVWFGFRLDLLPEEHIFIYFFKGKARPVMWEVFPSKQAEQLFFCKIFNFLSFNLEVFWCLTIIIFLRILHHSIFKSFKTTFHFCDILFFVGLYVGCDF